MSHFYDSLKGLLCGGMAKQAAKTVDETPEKVEKAIPAILSSLLAMYMKSRGQNVNNILTEAGNLRIADKIENICKEEPDKDQRRISDNLLQTLFADRAADFTAPIAEHAGISKVAANRLIYMIAPVVAGFLGGKLVNEKWSLTKLQDEIRNAKTHFAKDVPTGVVKTFDLSYILSSDSGHTPSTIVDSIEKKKGFGWIWWLLLIALLLLLFFGWRSCQEKKVLEPEIISSAIITAEDQPSETIVSGLIDLTLPNGQVITVAKDGIEERMIHFLNSDEYKNANNEQLKNKWFEFKDVAFQFDSTTELKASAEKELDNIAAILKAYPSAKIRIAGFADKKGTEQVNRTISGERAKSIEKILDGKGIASQIVKVEGFGEEFAKHQATETNDQRSEDRDIALGFVK